MTHRRLGEALEEAIPVDVPGRRAPLEAGVGPVQGGEVLPVVTAHARLVDGLHHLRQTPRAPRAVARGRARAALSLPRGVIPVPPSAVTLAADGIDEVLAAGCVFGGQWARCAFELGQVETRPGLSVANWVALLVLPPPTVELQSNLHEDDNHISRHSGQACVAYEQSHP